MPANPTSAAALATPYVLSCAEDDPGNSAFVQATIVAPNGTVSVYSPLVVSQGSRPARQPVTPRIPAGSTVGIWFGFNNDDLHLTGAGAAQCVNGVDGTDFGQFAACNAVQFFNAANTAIRNRTLRIPALGNDRTGAACPTISHFGIVDADPADNVQTTYLATANGRIAQDTAPNRQALRNFTVIENPSDNALVTDLIDPAIGCRPWTAPDLANPGHRVSSIALDSLQARALQANPVANVQTADPMARTLAGARMYRALVDQSLNVPFTGQYFCSNLGRAGANWLRAHRALLRAAPGTGDSPTLWDFLLTRYQGTYEGQDCQTITGRQSPL